MAPKTRRVRFVCVSDTHKASPLKGSFKLPKGDVLIHAGDLSNQGSLSELRSTFEWIEQSDYQAKIIIAGNHDITLDPEFYEQHGLYFHNQNPQSSEECCALVRGCPSVTYLNHEAATVRLNFPGDSQTHFKVFGSPYAPAKGLWAFGYNPGQAPDLWDKIPLDTDILITHTPPKYHCDESKDGDPAGCESLRHALWRVRPVLHVCGHVHEARGVERVLWDLDSPNLKYKEDNTGWWTNPRGGGKKQSLVNLSRKGGEPLVNDAFFKGQGLTEEFITKNPQQNPSKGVVPSAFQPKETLTIGSIGQMDEATLNPNPNEIVNGFPDFNNASFPSFPASSIQATRGYGGIPPSGRCDLEALTDRMGRRETCIVNAAIMATSWPHRSGKLGTKHNNPIVVDLDLPVWQGEAKAGAEADAKRDEEDA